MLDMIDIPIPPDANITVGRCPNLAVSESRLYGTFSSLANEYNFDLFTDFTESILFFKRLMCLIVSLTFPTIGATRDIIL